MAYYYHIYFGILLIGILLGLSRYKRITKSNQILVLLLIITLISEYTALEMGQRGIVNFFIYHFYAPIQYSLIAWAYYTETRLVWIKYSIPIMVVLAVLMSWFVQPLTVFNSHYICIVLLLTVIFCIIFFEKLLKHRSEYSFTAFPMFWISCGFLVFAVCNLFVFASYNGLFSMISTWERVFAYIRIFTNFLLYALFSIAFLSKQKALNS